MGDILTLNKPRYISPVMILGANQSGLSRHDCGGASRSEQTLEPASATMVASTPIKKEVSASAINDEQRVFLKLG